MLGAGEGRKMLRSAIGVQDDRVRTTRYGEAKHVRNLARLEGTTFAVTAPGPVLPIGQALVESGFWRPVLVDGRPGVTYERASDEHGNLRIELEGAEAAEAR